MNEELKLFPAIIKTFGYIKSMNLFFPLTFQSIMIFIISVPVIGGLCYFFLSLDNERNYSYKLDEVAGTGGFMTEKEIQAYEKKYIEPEPTDKNQPSPNMILGNRMRKPNDFRKMIGNKNILVVGGAGTGKSRFIIKPNILTLNSSFIITDPSGEIINALGKVLVEHGYKIKIFNISDMAHSNCYNPLEYIRDEAGVRMVIDCLINNTSNKNSRGDEFWTNSERLLYSACIFYLLEFCNDKSQKNLAGVTRMINEAMVDENNPNSKSPLDEIFEEVPKDSLAWCFYKGFKQGAGKTMKSIIISCISRLQPFFTPQVVNLTKRDEMQLDKIGDEKTALFLITPQADHTYDFLSAMLYSQLFETLYYKGEQQKAAGGTEALKVPVRCMMDEFANIGVIPEFPSKLSTMRKYNISATVILQDISQIEAMYKDEWKTMTGNCSTYIFLGTQEPTTLKWFSDMLGKKTITSRSRGTSHGGKGGSSRNFQQIGREVLTSDEMARLDSNKEIIFMQNQRPVLDSKFIYEKHSLYKQTGDADEKNMFLYNKMSEYDNSRLMNIDSMIKAQMEAARIEAEQNISNRKKTEQLNFKSNVFQAYQEIVPSPNEKQKAHARIINESVEKVLENYYDPIVMLTVSGVPPQELYGLSRAISIMAGKSPIILVSDIESDILVGCAYGDVEILDMVKSDYLANIEPFQKNACHFLIRPQTFEQYKEEILSRAA